MAKDKEEQTVQRVLMEVMVEGGNLVTKEAK